MRIRQAVAGTHAGAVRPFNEDAVLRLGRVPLYAIADGMGGAGAGDVAAQLALEVLKRHATAVRDRNIALAQVRSPEHRKAMQTTLDAVFNRISRQIREEAARRQESVMGASLVLATVVNEYAYVAHVGDARAYLLRDGVLQRLTEDHTLAELKLRRGRITRAEYEKHPERHVLYQSLGAPFELDVDMAEVRLEHNDVLVLCSDGVVGALDDLAMARELDPADLNNSLRGLLRACIQARCADNVSAVLMGMEGEVRTEAFLPEDNPTTPGVDPEPALEPASVHVRGTLFAGLSEQERKVIAPYLQERYVGSDQHVVAVGTPTREAHVIVGGRVQLSVSGIGLGELSDGVVGSLGEGSTLSVVQATSTSPVTSLVLTQARYEQLLDDHPHIAAKVAMGLVQARHALVTRMGARLTAVSRALSEG